MTQVHFYTLRQAGPAARQRQACRLAEEAFTAGERVLVWLQDPSAQEQFDTLLWTFSDGSFVPHEALAANPSQCEAPVQLHAGAALDEPVFAAGFTTLVMLRDTAVPEVLRFGKVIEVVDADDTSRQAGRARFRFYREHGSSPQHFEVND